MTRPTRLRRARALVLASALLAVPAVALGGGSPAGAAITGASISTSTPADGATVTVSGVATPGATLSIAECNTSAAVDGTACNNTSSTRWARFTADPVTGAFSRNIVVDDAFTNYSFVPGIPGSGTTTCDSVGSDPCAIQIVEYASNVPVDTETFPLTF